MTDTTETPVEAVEAVETVEATPEPVEAVEDKARRLGWRPEAEFKGDKGRWIDAETFVKRGEEILPIVQANNKALEKELKAVKATLKEFSENYTRVEQRAYQAAIRDLEARQAQAVEDNDVAAVRQITREMAELGNEVKPEPAPPAEDPLLTDWKEDNPWFGQDAIMRGAAVEIVNELIADGVTDLGRQLRAVDKRMREAFPQKFGNNARRAAPQTVEGGVSRARTGAKTVNDLPPEARATALRWAKQGLMTVDQYVKDYQF